MLDIKTQKRLKPHATAAYLWRYDPFLRPDWRYERTLKLVDGVDGPKPVKRRDDEFIRRYKKFLLKWRNTPQDDREDLIAADPGMFYAHRLRMRGPRDPETLFILESRLLSNQPIDQIAYGLNTLVEAVECYAAIWFDVQSRLDRHDWIFRHVLLPAFDRQMEAKAAAGLEQDDETDDERNLFWRTPPVARPYLDASLKYFAYFGGPLLCDFMLSGFRRGIVVTRQDEIAGWLDDDFITTLKRRSAQSVRNFEIDKLAVFELFNTHARILEMQKGMDTAEEGRNYLERHINDMLRELPWCSGTVAEEAYAETRIGHYDSKSGELRGDELLLVSAGADPPRLDELDMTFDSVRKDSDHGGDARQG